MKLFWLIFFAVTAVCGAAQDTGNWGQSPGVVLDDSLPDFVPQAEEAPENSQSEPDPKEANVLKRRLIEAVEDPSEIDSIEKALYVEEELLDGDIEKTVKGSEENEKDKKKSEKEFEIDLNSVSELLKAPEPERDSELLEIEKDVLNVDEALSFEAEEIADESLL